MIALCEARGVGVVKPNGSGHIYFPSASPPNLSGRRGFHTLARVVLLFLAVHLFGSRLSQTRVSWML